MVRGVKLEETPSGSYYNPSQVPQATTTAGPAQPVSNGIAGSPPNLAPESKTAGKRFDQHYRDSRHEHSRGVDKKAGSQT